MTNPRSLIADRVTNRRHREIRAWLDKFGLAPGMDVIEVGCGTGLVTALIADALQGTGSLVAFDLDEERAVAAHARVARHRNVAVEIADALTYTPEPVDMVVLPDVLEHIPTDLRPVLIRRVAGWLRPDGLVFIHTPNPVYLEWLAEHKPEELQEIDEPVYTVPLIDAAEAAGLRLHYLETYSIWAKGDYQAIVLRPQGFTSFA